MAAASAGSLFSQSASARNAAVMPYADYVKYDTNGLADLVAKGEVTALELLKTAIARAEQGNGKINAINLPYYDLARETIKKGLPNGPFHGVPWLLKVLNIQLTGTSTTNGSVFLKGSDGGGLIRIPASCCGLFGLKPTRARTPLGPNLFEGANGQALVHAITRSVRDSALLLDVTRGAEAGIPWRRAAS